MLNRVVLMGRITQELDLKQSQSGIAVLSFTIAVDRSFVKQGEERQADFINCVAWRQQAEFISKYFGKGRMIALEGNLRTRTYDDKNGTKHYVTEVYVDSVSFTGEAKPQGTYSNQQNNQPTPPPPAQDKPPVHQSYTPVDPNAQINLSDFEEILSDDGAPF